MTDDPERDYLVEAQMLLKGLTGLLPQREHLQAIEDYYEVQLIALANDLELLKQNVLDRAHSHELDEYYDVRIMTVANDLEQLKRRVLNGSQ